MIHGVEHLILVPGERHVTAFVFVALRLERVKDHIPPHPVERLTDVASAAGDYISERQVHRFDAMNSRLNVH